MFENEFIQSSEARRWFPSDIQALAQPYGKSELFPFCKSTLADSAFEPLDRELLGRLEWCYLLNQYLSGERFAVAACEQLLGAGILAPGVSNLLSLVLDDEKRHVEALESYLYQRVGNCFVDVTPFERLCNKALTHSNPLVPQLLLHVVIEPFGVGSISANLKYVKDSVCTELVAALTRDEMKHLEFGQKLLEGLESIPPLVAQSWVKACVIAMKQSSAPVEAYVRSFPAGTDTIPLAQHAFKSSAMSQQARHVATQLLRAWRGIPYLAPLASELSQIMQSSYSDSMLNLLEF